MLDKVGPVKICWRKLLAVVAVLPAFCVVAATIPEQIDAILARSTLINNTWTIIIENESGTVRYYQKNPTTGKAPASNTKLFTTAAAFGLLGTNYAFPTRIYRDGAINNGTLTGNLNLVCEHDPTWNTSVFSSARKPLDTIAAALKSQGLTNVVGNVQCYGLCAYGFGSTDSLSATTTQAKNADAAVAFQTALTAQGISVSGSAVGQTGFSAPGTLFYTYYSTDLTYGGKPLRLDVACNPLLKVSHNVMADVILRHIGWKLGSGDSYSAGAALVVPWLKNTAGISTNGIIMNDGSGLSHGNSFSAQQTISLLRYMLGAFPSWDDGLPIGCVDGTISGRFCGTAGSGKVHAKTGSLSISIALSGYIDNPNDNRRYLFSFISNDSSGIDQTETRIAIDDCVVLMGARGVPTSPQLSTVTNTGTNSLVIAWSDEPFVRTGYKVYSSTNGINWDAGTSVGPAVQSYIDKDLPAGTKKFYRVTVLGSSGESVPSRVYGAQVGSGRAPVVIVDGNDRWQFQTNENPNAINHNFAAITGQSISGVSFDTVNHNSVIGGNVMLTNYSAAIWLCGEESTQDESFSSTEQTLVTAFQNAGGHLFVSGSEIAWDLDRDSGPTVADRNFCHNQLRAGLNGNANDDANTYSFAAITNGLFTVNPSGVFDNGANGLYNVDFPDVLTPTNGAVAAINYSGGRGGPAAVTFDGTAAVGKLVYFGFPFETITNSAVREAYMSDVLRFFNVLPLPKITNAQFVAPNQVKLTWSASAGLKYRVQSRATLSGAGWSDASSDITATNTAATFTDSPSAGPKFYRIQLVN